MIFNNESKTRFQEKWEKHCSPRAYFLKLQNCFGLVVSSRDPGLQEGNNAGVCQLAVGAVPAELLPQPCVQPCRERQP